MGASFPLHYTPLREKEQLIVVSLARTRGARPLAALEFHFDLQRDLSEVAELEGFIYDRVRAFCESVFDGDLGFARDEHDDRCGLVRGLCPFEQFDSASVWHRDIGENEIDAVLFEIPNSIVSALGFADVSDLRKERDDDFAEDVIVFDDEDSKLFCHSASY